MTNYAGYMGKVIRLDLGSRSVSEYPWTDRDRQLYLGGKAMASKIMYDNFTGSEKPLEPENIIVISTGPLTGTGAPSSSRFNISTLSPQTGITTSSNCGGNFGHYLKKAGYDALIIAGKCEKLTWVEIHNDIIKFHDAEELKGGDGLFILAHYGLDVHVGEPHVRIVDPFFRHCGPQVLQKRLLLLRRQIGLFHRTTILSFLT